MGARAASGHGPRVRSGQRVCSKGKMGCTRVTSGGRCLWGEQGGCVLPCRAEWWQGRSPRGWREAPWAAVPAAGRWGGGDRASEQRMDPSAQAALPRVGSTPHAWAPHSVLQVGGWWVQSHRPPPSPYGAAPTVAAHPDRAPGGSSGRTRPAVRHGSKSYRVRGRVRWSGQRAGGLTWDTLLCTPWWVRGKGKVTRGGWAML